MCIILVDPDRLPVWGTGGTFYDIQLPADVLDKTNYRYFERFTGKTPKQLNRKAIIEESQRLEMMINAIAAVQPGLAVNTCSAAMVKDFFSH